VHYGANLFSNSWTGVINLSHPKFTRIDPHMLIICAMHIQQICYSQSYWTHYTCPLSHLDLPDKNMWSCTYMNKLISTPQGSNCVFTKNAVDLHMKAVVGKLGNGVSVSHSP